MKVYSIDYSLLPTPRFSLIDPLIPLGYNFNRSTIWEVPMIQHARSFGGIRMDVFNKPNSVDEDSIKNLGPLTALAGTWEGDQGVDVSPSREGSSETHYRERIRFEPMGPVVNGPQVLYGLRYSTIAWPLADEKPFHEEVGYWLWDGEAQHVMRCFIVPRGVTVNAGGPVDPKANTFEIRAELGSETYGVMSNPFLDKAFKTVRYDLKVTFHDDGSFSYAEDTHLKIHGLPEIFHHTDQNRLVKG